MKSFGDWVQSMSGKIPDASHVDNTKPPVVLQAKRPTNLQVRYYFATLLVGRPTDIETLTSWLCVLLLKSADFKGDTTVHETATILGDKYGKSYWLIKRTDEAGRMAWFEDLEDSILSGDLI